MKTYGLIMTFYVNSTHGKRTEGTWVVYWLPVELALCECHVGEHSSIRHPSACCWGPLPGCPVLPPCPASPPLPLTEHPLRACSLEEVFSCSSSHWPPRPQRKVILLQALPQHPVRLQGAGSTAWLHSGVVYVYVSSCCTLSSMKGGTMSVGSFLFSQHPAQSIVHKNSVTLCCLNEWIHHILEMLGVNFECVKIPTIEILFEGEAGNMMEVGCAVEKWGLCLLSNTLSFLCMCVWDWVCVSLLTRSFQSKLRFNGSIAFWLSMKAMDWPLGFAF